MCWEPRGVLVFSRLMLLLIMEACPPPTLGLRPRRDLSACVRTRARAIVRGDKTYGAMVSGLTPREGPSGIVEYCVIGNTRTSPQPGLSVCSKACRGAGSPTTGIRPSPLMRRGVSVASDGVAVGVAIPRTRAQDRGEFNCSGLGSCISWREVRRCVAEPWCSRLRFRRFNRIAVWMLFRLSGWGFVWSLR
jgi:hypothetical protein